MNRQFSLCTRRVFTLRELNAPEAKKSSDLKKNCGFRLVYKGTLPTGRRRGVSLSRSRSLRVKALNLELFFSLYSTLLECIPTPFSVQSQLSFKRRFVHVGTLFREAAAALAQDRGAASVRPLATFPAPQVCLLIPLRRQEVISYRTRENM